MISFVVSPSCFVLSVHIVQSWTMIAQTRCCRKARKVFGRLWWSKPGFKMWFQAKLVFCVELVLCNNLSHFRSVTSFVCTWWICSTVGSNVPPRATCPSIFMCSRNSQNWKVDIRKRHLDAWSDVLGALEHSQRPHVRQRFETPEFHSILIGEDGTECFFCAGWWAKASQSAISVENINSDCFSGFDRVVLCVRSCWSTDYTWCYYEVDHVAERNFKWNVQPRYVACYGTLISTGMLLAIILCHYFLSLQKV